MRKAQASASATGEQGIEEIADPLDADLTLEGCQQFEGQVLRVTARLIDVRTNTLIWADRMETEVEHLFDVAAEINLRVANGVEDVVARLRAEIDPLPNIARAWRRLWSPGRAGIVRRRIKGFRHYRPRRPRHGNSKQLFYNVWVMQRGGRGSGRLHVNAG